MVICLFVDDSDFNRPNVERAMQFLMSKADELKL